MNNETQILKVLEQISKNIFTLNKTIEKLNKTQKELTNLIFEKTGIEMTQNDELRCEMVEWFKNKNCQVDRVGGN